MKNLTPHDCSVFPAGAESSEHPVDSCESLEDEPNLMILRPQNIYRMLGRLQRFRDRLRQ